MMPDGVLLDTSFFLRFLKTDDPLFSNAVGYYKYFLENEIPLFISTVSVAEFCVGGSIDQLPLKDLRILPFNIDHAKRTGEFARVLFTERKLGRFNPSDRLLIPNDTKLFSQADVETGINAFLTSDSESLKAYTVLKENSNIHFSIIDINIEHNEFFGLLNL